jgi:hypothetical protein
VILAGSFFRRAHDACVDQAVWIACLGIPLEVVHIVKRDAPFLIGHRLSEDFTGIVDSTYVSPALGCWASWLSHEGANNSYVSLDKSGQPVSVNRHPLVTQVIFRDEEEHPREPHAWFPAPVVRPELGIIGAAGDRHVRHYLDRNRHVVAVERDLPHHDAFAFIHHYLAMELRRVVEACSNTHLVPVWAVRLWREATPALRMEGNKHVLPSGLIHRSRDVFWLLFWNDQKQDFDVVPQGDVLELCGACQQE